MKPMKSNSSPRDNAYSPEALLAAIRSGDQEAVISFFKGMTESQRSAFKATEEGERRRIKQAEEELSKAWEALRSEGVASGLETSTHAATSQVLIDTHKLLSVAKTGLRPLVWCKGSLEDIKKWEGLSYLTMENVLLVFEQRRPPWLQRWAEWEVTREYYRWDVVRCLELSGAIVEPANPHYRLETNCRAGLSSWHADHAEWIELSLAKRFAVQWTAFRSRFWEVFEIEGTSFFSPAGSINLAVINEMISMNLIDRLSVLKATLKPLEREFAAKYAAYFVRLHEGLQATVEERALLLDQYLPLLESTTQATVKFALHTVSKLNNASPQPAYKLLPFLQPVMLAKTKGLVQNAISLISQLVSSDPAEATTAAGVVAGGCLHSSPDVQKSVLKWLGKHQAMIGDQMSGVLTPYFDALSPSVREYTLAMCGSSFRVGHSDTAKSRVLVELTIQPPPPRLSPSRALPYLDGLQDLITAAAHTLEEGATVQEMELVVCALGRLHNLRPDNFGTLTSPLRKRMKQRWERVYWDHRGPYFALLDTWISRSLSPLWSNDYVAKGLSVELGSGPDHLWARHLFHAAQLIITGSSLQLLAEPTHQGGWIDPEVFVRRYLLWQQQGSTPPPFELNWALLRLAPENRDAALSIATTLTGEEGAAIRFALGENETMATTVPLWISSCRSRQHDGTFPELANLHPDLGGDAAVPCEFIWEIYKCITMITENSYGIAGAFAKPVRDQSFPADNVIAMLGVSHWMGTWPASIWPAQSQHFLAFGLHSECCLQALLDPLVECGVSGALALTLGSKVSEPKTRSLATDALLSVMESGRLDVDLLAAMWHRMLELGYSLKHPSIALTTISLISPGHAGVVWRLLTKILSGVPIEQPRDLHFLLQLLQDLAVGMPPLPDATVEWLKAVKTGGKTKNLLSGCLAEQVDIP